MKGVDGGCREIYLRNIYKYSVRKHRLSIAYAYMFEYNNKSEYNSFQNPQLGFLVDYLTINNYQ